MIIKKQYLTTRPVCKVVFGIPAEIAHGADAVCLVGDFNNWNQTATPMKKLKNGSFSIAIDLETGREYQFRYLIGGKYWENAWNADKYVSTPFGDDFNSVIIA